MVSLPEIPNPYAGAHKSPNGPGDARPTATQIVKDNNLVGELHDKTILVTGGTDGLGKGIVEVLAQTGARIFFTARNPSKAEAVVKELGEARIGSSEKPVRIEWVQMDNASLASIRKGAEDFKKRSQQLNILINNAGIGMVPKEITEDGYESQFQVNHLAHFLLFQLLKPLLLGSSTPSFHSRVVAISSVAHTLSSVQLDNYGLEKPLQHPWASQFAMGDNVWNSMVAYGQSKTANIWMCNEIERRYGDQGLHGLSVQPGFVQTKTYNNVEPKAMELMGQGLSAPEVLSRWKSIEQGNATPVLAAIGKAFEGKGGLYLDNCGVSRPLNDDAGGDAGFGPWAYDQVDGEKQLWADSLKMVGLEH